MTLLPHSSLQPGLTNAEGMALNQSPEGAVASYYSESKGFDYNNPSRNQGGKVRGKYCSILLHVSQLSEVRFAFANVQTYF